MKSGRSGGGDRRKAPAKNGDSTGENWEQQADYPVPLEGGAAARGGGRSGQEPLPDGPADEGQFGEAATRDERIRLKAYLRAQQRGFDGGNEMEDWLAAEREVDGDGDGARR
jgi:hypothetical protein